MLRRPSESAQYASAPYRARLAQHGAVQSISRRGDCYDNAVAESFFHTLKTELVYQQRYRTREEARLAIFEYIAAFYNRTRRHSTNSYRPPDAHEAQYVVSRT